MSRSAKGDTDGPNLPGSTARLAAQADVIVRYASRWAAQSGDVVYLRSINLYPPSRSRNGMWLIVGKGFYGGYNVVAFHRAPDVITALVGFLSRWYTGKLVWKKDSYSPEG